MPLFDYECTNEQCHQFDQHPLEILVDRYNEPVTCPDCGQEMLKLPAIPNVYIPGIPLGQNERYH